ncbi:MAG: FKBP-type peptidyl-prolyl cis-trans isomerase [Crocinitomicaceae bacterium]|nr:FKBP-type peptidyl-prolyl cis-trans isomerase [Crocinitomicaceae bacterium]
MKKWILIAPLFFALFACGDGEPVVEELVLEKFDDKLSYTLGAISAKDLLQNPQISGDKLSKDKLLEGFKMNFTANEVTDCQSCIEGLFGVNGSDFNSIYLDSGSVCVGRYVAYRLFSDLNSFDKISSIDTSLMYRGFSDALNSLDTTVLSLEDQMAINDEFANSINALMAEKMEAQWADNRSMGEEFLAQNALRDGVITTATGLQYEIIKNGSGAKPTLESQVDVHYHGTMVDGTVFDSSVERGESIQFGVTGVISGWTEVLQLMPKGSKFRVYIPQDLAYGAYPNPQGPILPYSALIFDIELLDFQ